MTKMTSFPLIRSYCKRSYRFVVPDGRDLSSEHDRREEGEEEALEDQEEEEYYRGRRREGRTAVPLGPEARQEVVEGQEQGVDRHHSYVELEQGGKRAKKPGWNERRTKLTVKSTKNFWLFSPTQLLTQGQWWSIFLMHL